MYFHKVSSSLDFQSPPAKSIENKVCTPISPFPSIDQLKNACSLFDDATDQDLAVMDSVGVKRNPLVVNAVPKSLEFSSPSDDTPKLVPAVPFTEIPPSPDLNSSPSSFAAERISTSQGLIATSSVSTIPQPSPANNFSPSQTLPVEIPRIVPPLLTVDEISNSQQVDAHPSPLFF